MRSLKLYAVMAVGLTTMIAADIDRPFPSRPKLVVLVAVDQFRYDYLTRFASEYKGGFRRLLDRGAVFANANLAHYPSITAVGHSVMLTGASPALSGIIGNNWYDRTTGKNVSSVSDTSESQLGSTGTGASPRRLLVSTVGDELKLADRASRVIGLSFKDRGAILPAGHAADAAYWYDTKTGAFVSSTYYFKELPSWVKSFNDSRLVDKYAGAEWTFAGKSRKMPAETGPKLDNAIDFSPYGNELLEAFAERTIDAERLGQRGAMDLLTVSFSCIDAVGHQTGPLSPEIHDLAVRLDGTLERLFLYLDKTIGLRNVEIILTADHGAVDLPETMSSDRMPGGRIIDTALTAMVQARLEQQHGGGSWVLAINDGMMYLNADLIRDRKLKEEDVQDEAAAAIAAAPHVFRVYTRHQLRSGALPKDTLGETLSASLNWARSADLEVILEPYWVRPASNTGHDTPFAYDTHIPLIFMGPNIRPGLYFQNVILNDLAPTLASLLSVQTPSGSTGRVLHEILPQPGVAAH
jgi:predicted AlkP superfamily pyrophosphatase or phosphodiesterase